MALFRTNFDFKTDGLPAERDPFRHLSRVVKPGTAVCREPTMNDGGTTMMVLPMPDFQDPDYKTKGVVRPDRFSEQAGDFSSWIFKADGIRRFGKTPVTLLFDDPEPSSGFNKYVDNPAWAIYDTMMNVVKAGQRIDTPFGSSDSDQWTVLLKGLDVPGQKAKYADITRPGELYLCYGLIWRHGKDDYFSLGAPFGAAKDDLPVVFVQTLNMFQSFFERVEERDKQTGKVLNPTFTGQKFFHFYDRKGFCPAEQKAASALAMQNASAGFGVRQRSAPGAGGFAPAAQKQLGGYGVYMSDTASGMPPPQDNPIDRRIAVNVAVNKLRPWEEVLRGYTPDETAREIANHSGIPLSVLYHCWKHKPHWFTDEMTHRLRNPVSTSAPAGGGWGQQVDHVTQPGTFGGEWSQPPQGHDAAPAPASHPFGSLPWDGHAQDAAPQTAPARGFAAPPEFTPGVTANPAAMGGQHAAPQVTERDAALAGPAAAPTALGVAVDPVAAADSQAKFREFMANQQRGQQGGGVARSQAARR